MKKPFVLLTVLTALSFQQSKAQVSVNINIGSQPVWGPVGYDHVDYYYLPDIESYYYVPTRQFIYLNAGQWIFSASLPGRYRNYDLYRGYKVVINNPRPYLHHKDYRVRYSNYRHHYGQPAIRYSNNPRYYVVKGHPKYSQRPSRWEGRDGGRDGYQRSRGYDRYDKGRGNDKHGRGNSHHGKGKGHR